MTDVSNLPEHIKSAVAAEMRILNEQFSSAAEARFLNANITSASPLVHAVAEKVPALLEQLAHASPHGALKKGFIR